MESDLEPASAPLPPTAPRGRRWLRRAAWFAAGVSMAMAASCAIAGRSFSGPRYDGPASDHFDGEKFFYPAAPMRVKSTLEVMKWRITGKRGAWEDRPLAGPTTRPDARVDGGVLRATFVNHATVLLQMDGLNILTDPIWSERASPLSFAGPRRYRPPGVAFEDLPPIDVVLVSHNHYDHLDVATLRRLAADHAPRIVVPLGVKALLDEKGVAGGEELDWWQEIDAGNGVRIALTPARHWSARGTHDRSATLWGGFAIQSERAGLAYYAGDTGYGPFYADVRERFGAPRLAILPIGAYKPEWFMAEGHQNPAEAVRAHRELGAAASLAVHWGTFPLADDSMDDPPTDLRAALAEAGLTEDDFWLLDNGGVREAP